MIIIIRIDLKNEDAGSLEISLSGLRSFLLFGEADNPHGKK
jgi:hypothetical protein